MTSVEQIVYGPIRPTPRGELLLELLSEEIPAKMQRGAIAELTQLLREGLATAKIPAAAMRGYVTPRRLTVVADGIGVLLIVTVAFASGFELLSETVPLSVPDGAATSAKFTVVVWLSLIVAGCVCAV